MTPEITEAARKLAESLSSTLSDAQRAAYVKSVAWVAEGLREIVEESQSPTEVVVRMSHTVCRVLAEVQGLPMGDAVDFCEQNMVAYGLAAGNLAGVYELPGDEGSEPKVPPTPLRVVPRNEQVGQYL